MEWTNIDGRRDRWTGEGAKTVSWSNFWLHSTRVCWLNVDVNVNICQWTKRLSEITVYLTSEKSLVCGFSPICGLYGQLIRARAVLRLWSNWRLLDRWDNCPARAGGLAGAKCGQNAVPHNVATVAGVAENLVLVRRAISVNGNRSTSALRTMTTAVGALCS